MKLLSTLRYQSSVGAPPGTGNYGGDLRLFFTTLNPTDTKPGPGTPPSTWWLGGAGKAAQDTYKLPNGDVIALNLNLQATVPNELFVFGNIEVTASGTMYGPPIGQGGLSFVAGKPLTAIMKGRTQSQASGKHFDIGFEIAVPWDGVQADCHGQWWAVWW